MFNVYLVLSSAYFAMHYYISISTTYHAYDIMTFCLNLPEMFILTFVQLYLYVSRD